MDEHDVNQKKRILLITVYVTYNCTQTYIETLDKYELCLSEYFNYSTVGVTSLPLQGSIIFEDLHCRPQMVY